MNDTEIYKAQITKLIKMLEETASPSHGLKRATMEIFGTLNHRIRQHYERRSYATRLTGGYTSSNRLKKIVDDSSTEWDELTQAILSSDVSNSKQKIHLKFLLKRIAIELIFNIYLLFYAVARKTLRLAKKTLKRVKK